MIEIANYYFKMQLQKRNKRQRLQQNGSGSENNAEREFAEIKSLKQKCKRMAQQNRAAARGRIQPQNTHLSCAFATMSPKDNGASRFFPKSAKSKHDSSALESRSISPSPPHSAHATQSGRYLSKMSQQSLPLSRGQSPVPEENAVSGKRGQSPEGFTRTVRSQRYSKQLEASGFQHGAEEHASKLRSSHQVMGQGGKGGRGYETLLNQDVLLHKLRPESSNSYSQNHSYKASQQIRKDEHGLEPEAKVYQQVGTFGWHEQDRMGLLQDSSVLNLQGGNPYAEMQGIYQATNNQWLSQLYRQQVSGYPYAELVPAGVMPLSAQPVIGQTSFADQQLARLGQISNILVQNTAAAGARAKQQKTQPIQSTKQPEFRRKRKRLQNESSEDSHQTQRQKRRHKLRELQSPAHNQVKTELRKGQSRKEEEQQYIREIRNLLLQRQRGGSDQPGAVPAQQLKQMRESLRRKDEIIRTQSNELEQLRGSVSMLRSKNNELERQLQQESKKESYRGGRRQTMTSQEESRFNGRSQDLQKIVWRHTTAGESGHQEEVQLLKRKLQELQMTLKMVKTGRSDPEEGFTNRSTSRSRELQVQLRTLQFEYSKVERENEGLRRDLKLRQEMGSLREREKEKLLEEMRLSCEGEGQRESDLLRELEEKCKDLKRAEKELGSLRGQLMNLSFNLQLKDNQLESSKSGISSLKQQLQHQKAESRRREKELEARSRQLDHDLRRRNEELRIARNAIEIDSREEDRVGRPQAKDVSHLEQELQNLRQSLREKEQRMKAKEESERKLILTLKEKENEIKMDARLKEFQLKKHDELQKETDKIRLSLEEAKDKLDDERKKRFALEAEKERLDADLKLLEKELGGQRKDAQKRKAQSQGPALASRVSSLAEEVDRLRRQLQNQRKDSCRAKEGLEEWRQRGESLQQQNQLLKDRLARFKTDAEGSEHSYRELDKRVKQYQAVVADKNRIIEGITIDLRLKDAACKSLSNQLKDAGRERQELERKAIESREELAYLHRRQSSMEKQLADKNQKINQLGLQSAEQGKTLDKIKADKLKVELELGLLRAQHQHTAERLKDKIRENDRLKDRLDEQEASLQNKELLEAELRQLRLELQEKNLALSEIEAQPSQATSRESDIDMRADNSAADELKEALQQNLQCHQQIRSLIALTKGLESRLKQEHAAHQHEERNFEMREAQLCARVESLQASLEESRRYRQASLEQTRRVVQEQVHADRMQPKDSQENRMLREALAQRTHQLQMLGEENFRSRLEINGLRDNLEDRESKLIVLNNLLEQRGEELFRLESTLANLRNEDEGKSGQSGSSVGTSWQRMKFRLSNQLAALGVEGCEEQSLEELVEELVRQCSRAREGRSSQQWVSAKQIYLYKEEAVYSAVRGIVNEVSEEGSSQSRAEQGEAPQEKPVQVEETRIEDLHLDYSGRGRVALEQSLSRDRYQSREEEDSMQ